MFLAVAASRNGPSASVLRLFRRIRHAAGTPTWFTSCARSVKGIDYNVQSTRSLAEEKGKLSRKW